MTATSCPVVDISAFTHPDSCSTVEKEATSRKLAAALSPNGFICLEGHGIEPEFVRCMFDMSRRFFELPKADKMKAPHPDAIAPHRGYSTPGREMSHMEDDDKHVGNKIKKGEGELSEYKETFVIGHEENYDEANIWLPESVLPGFRAFENDAYSRLQDLVMTVANALAYRLNLTESKSEAFRSIHDSKASQLRLLRYPSIDVGYLDTEEGSRLPAHNDWSSFTLLFQQKISGPQFEDRSLGRFVDVIPREGQIALNVGDVLERLSNGQYPSSLHRVVRPSTLAEESNGSMHAPERYSVAFFAVVSSETSLAPMPSLIARDGSPKFETVTFGEYAAKKAKWHYQGYVKE